MHRRFRGSLTNYRLALLVPALCENESLSGWLKVHKGPLGRSFQIHEGNVVAVSASDPREHLSQLLVERGLLEMHEAVRAFEESRASRLPLGAYLIGCDRVPPRAVRELLAQKVREGLVDCYGWESGEVEWLPAELIGVPPRGLWLELPLRRLHLEAVEAWKQWRRFRTEFPEPSLHLEVFGAPVAADPRELALLEKAIAGATIEQLLEHGNKLETGRLLLKLLEEGRICPEGMRSSRFVRARQLGSMIDQARELYSQGQFSQAAHVAERVLEREPVAQAGRIYDEATRELGQRAREELEALEDRAYAAPFSGPAPESLTSADLLLHTLLMRERSLRRALERTPLETVNAYFAVKRLVAEGLVRLWPKSRTGASERGVALGNEQPN